VIARVEDHLVLRNQTGLSNALLAMTTPTRSAGSDKGQPAEASGKRKRATEPLEDDAEEEVVERRYRLQDIDILECPICSPSVRLCSRYLQRIPLL
jgi:hypothetical protein